MKWPAHGTAVRLASKHTEKIRNAFKDSLDADSIVQSWNETHVHGAKITPQLARDWANVNIHFKNKPLEDALRFLYADGYVLGNTAGRYMLEKFISNKAAVADVYTVNWDTWKPGNQAASALLEPKESLKTLLDNRSIIVKGISDTKLNTIGSILSQSLNDGLTVNETAKLLSSVIEDPDRAALIAQTEMSRAVSVASRELYQDSGVTQVDWLVAEGCSDCQDNADASPIDIGTEFPSGDTEPPAHPNCMCSLAPAEVDNSAYADIQDQIDNTEE